MIFEDLKKEFMKNINDAWQVEFDITKMKGKKEMERHVEIWNKMAEFMDYGILLAPNLIRFIPIYFTRKFPNGETTVETDDKLFTPEDEYFAPGILYRRIESQVKSEYMKRYRIQDWTPTLNFNHAKECEARLLKKGEYNSINSRVGSRFVKINYSGSNNFMDVTGKGKNELEAICNACIKFSERENIHEIESASAVAIENTYNYPTLF
jgi:hypothetical protein